MSSTTEAAREPVRPPIRRSRKVGLGSVLQPQRAGVVYALILIALAFEVITSAKGLPSFLAISNIHNILDQAAIDGILTIAMTCLLITGHFDLSIGANAGLCAGVGLNIANGHGVVLGTVVALAVGIAVGLINGALVQYAGVNAFIVTLGTLTAIQGVLLVSSNGQTIQATGSQWGSIGSGTWTIPTVAGWVVGIALVALGVGQFLSRLRRGAPGISASATGPAAAGAVILIVTGAAGGLLTETRETWIMLAFTVVTAAALRYTVFGRRLYAVGGNLEAARLSGLRIAPYRVGAFVLCGLAAGFAGLLYAGRFGAVPPTALNTEELPVIAAAVLGGTSLFGGAGFVGKSIVGVLILQSLSNGFGLLNLGANYQYLVQGIVIVVAAAVYTVGGRRRRRAAQPPGPVTAADPSAARAEGAEAAVSSHPVTASGADASGALSMGSLS